MQITPINLAKYRHTIAYHGLYRPSGLLQTAVRYDIQYFRAPTVINTLSSARMQRCVEAAHPRVHAFNIVARSSPTWDCTNPAINLFAINSLLWK